MFYQVTVMYNSSANETFAKSNGTDIQIPEKNDSNDHRTIESSSPNISRVMSKDELQNFGKAPPEMNLTRLYQPEKMKEILRKVDMANALYHEAANYPMNVRFKKLYTKYQELFHHGWAFFDAAIRGTLYQGEIGEWMKAFQSGDMDAKKIYSNYEAIGNKKADAIIANINEVHRQDTIKREEEEREKRDKQTVSNVLDIIAKHQASKATTTTISS